MSAYMVDRATIDVLVHAATRTGLERSPMTYYFAGDTHRCEPSPVGQLLIDANLRSIQARYPDCIAHPEHTPGPIAHYWDTPYRFGGWLRRELSIVAQLKALACFVYQACESDDWHTSEAAAFCDALQHRLIRRLPGYDEAPWGVEDGDEAVSA